MAFSTKWQKGAQSKVLKLKKKSGKFRTKLLSLSLIYLAAFSEVMDVSEMCGMQYATFAAIIRQDKENWGRH